MILCIFLLVLFLIILILVTFFTIYFIIPSLKDEKNKEDPIIPEVELPQKLLRQKNLTPYESIEFIERVVMPVSLDKKLELLNNNTYFDEDYINTVKTTENPEYYTKKDFKIWEYCYKLLKYFKLI